MMYIAKILNIMPPKNSVATILWNLASAASYMVFADIEAVKHFVMRVRQLKSVCNHNNRGEKIEFTWDEDIRTLDIACGSNLVASIWFCPVLQPSDVLEVERIIDLSVHKDNLVIFDQYTAEKNAEKELGL